MSFHPDNRIEALFVMGLNTVYLHNEVKGAVSGMVLLANFLSVTAVSSPLARPYVTTLMHCGLQAASYLASSQIHKCVKT